MDYWQRPQFDFGLTGPEKGATGGKVLLLGPGQKAPDLARVELSPKVGKALLCVYETEEKPADHHGPLVSSPNCFRDGTLEPTLNPL
jgi:hypothetical protein